MVDVVTNDGLRFRFSQYYRIHETSSRMKSILLKLKCITSWNLASVKSVFYWLSHKMRYYAWNTIHMTFRKIWLYAETPRPCWWTIYSCCHKCWCTSQAVNIKKKFLIELVPRILIRHQECSTFVTKYTSLLTRGLSKFIILLLRTRTFIVIIIIIIISASKKVYYIN